MENVDSSAFFFGESTGEIPPPFVPKPPVRPPPHPGRPSVLPARCGNTNATSTRIVGGEDAPPGEHIIIAIFP